MYVVTGATGNTGGEVVAALAAAGLPVRAVTRSAGGALPPGVETAQGDLDDPPSLSGALRGGTGLFLLAGYRDMPGVLTAARDAGVLRIVLLSAGCVVGGDPDNVVVRYNLDAEAAVCDSGLAATVLRPSGFMSNALSWLPQLREGDLVRQPFGDVPIAAVDPYDTAAVAVRALTADGHACRAYRLTGPEPLLPAEQVAILGAALGRDLRFEGQPDDEALAEMKATMPPGYAEAFADFFLDGHYDDSVVHPTVREVTGREPRRFAQWVESHLEAFARS